MSKGCAATGHLISRGIPLEITGSGGARDGGSRHAVRRDDAGCGR